MDIPNLLLSCFPNTINKESEVFGAIVANSNKNGVFETELSKVKTFIAQWTGTPDLYEQTDEMLELTASFFSFLEKYNNETDANFKRRIKTIFQRGGDTKWGNPYDVKKLFINFFPTAKIFLVENTNSIDDNLLIDGDFQTKDTAWKGIDDDESSNCHYSKPARFSKGFGVEIKNGGEFYQTITNDNSEKDYYVLKNDTYKSIAQDKFGNENLADYIQNYKSNPETISGPVKATCSVVFSRNIAKDDELIIPSGTVLSNGNYKYITQEDAVIKSDDSAAKATGEIIFSRASQMDQDTEIPEGTKVSDGIHIFETTEDAKVLAGTVNSDPIPIIATDYGTDYNLAAETITTLVSSISTDIVSVINPNATLNGYNGKELNSNNVLVEAEVSGIVANTEIGTISTIVTELSESVTVKNIDAATNGYDGDKILIPSRNTYFLHLFLNGKIKVEITDNNGRYWNNKHYFDKTNAIWVDGEWQTDEYQISYDAIAEMVKKNSNNPEYVIEPTKAKGNVYFTCTTAPTENITIPIGTRVSDGNHVYKTTSKGTIKADENISEEVEIQAVSSGWDYDIAANKINTIVDSISGIDGVYNEKQLTGGTDCDWTQESLYFYTDNTISSIKIRFIGVERSFIDYVRLFAKQYYPSFSVIAQFQTYSGVDAAALYPGQEDPVILASHENASYYDNDFFTGVYNGGYSQDIYQGILDYARSVGIKAYVEVVNKDDE